MGEFTLHLLARHVLKTVLINRKFIESLRLEKSSKIIRSNCQPITTTTRSFIRYWTCQGFFSKDNPQLSDSHQCSSLPR